MENQTLEKKIEYFNTLRPWEKEQLRQAILLQNQFSESGQRIYKKSQEKGILL